MPVVLGQFPDRHGRASMVSAMVAGVDRCRWISKGRFRPNRLQTRANAGAPHFDGKNDGKFLRCRRESSEHQQLRALVDD